jgi:hypothetical protein
VRWTVRAPDAALAWFALLADLRLQGAGPFPLVASPPGPAPPSFRELATGVAAREFEVLHFVPLYHPSADRGALAAAIRAAASTPARAPAPRAELVVAVLSRSISADARRDRLPAIADALGQVRHTAPSPDRMAAWQQRLDSLYLPALAPWLRAERLDAGTLIVSPAIGAEGRLFAGTADRADNLVAVGTFPDDPESDAPLLAFARELCFPAVTRAAGAARGFDAADPRSARRASIAAVRCGAELLDRLVPSRAAAYRAFWLRRAGTRDGGDFDAAFPADPALRESLAAALRRVERTR